MELKIKQMNHDEAVQISKWVYKEPYSIYSMNESDECIRELLDRSYFSVLDKDNTIIGYYCFGKSAQVPIGNKFGAYDNKDIMDIGLGIRPDLCGKRLGADFLSSGLDFARKNLSAKEFRLTVASFNERAIKVYKSIGFKKVMSFERITEQSKIEFYVMVLS